MTGKVIAIVGGGLSGTLVAIRLLDLVKPPQMMRVYVIEPRPLLGPGMAYSTAYSEHLMNVRSGRLSLVEDDPEHFVKWVRAHSNLPMDAESFAPRFLYGRYVHELLAAAEAKAHPYIALKHIRAEAVDVRNEESGVELSLDDGSSIRTDACVLAPGNAAPNQQGVLDAEFRSSPYYLGSVWRPDAVVSLTPDSSVLLVGSGLTAVDVTVALESLGFRGDIHVVSRNGRWPAAHALYSPCSRDPWADTNFNSLHALLSAVRKEIRWAEAQGGDWRAVVDSLRPHVNRLWQGLPAVEQRRFFRHLRPYWEIHRHRMAPQVAAVIDGLTRKGRLFLHPGRVRAAYWDEEGAEVRIEPRGKLPSFILRVNQVINCTGPECNYRNVTQPLWRNLFASGLVGPGPLGLGLGTGPEGELADAQGRLSERLFTLGPTRIGSLIETTAVIDIRTQATVLASRLHGLIEPSLRDAPQAKLLPADDSADTKRHSVAT